MLTAYFDASGHPTQQALVVAGFIANTQDWLDFERLWSARLAEDDLSYFHMQQFAQSDGRFASWKGDEPRRRRLLGDLYGIIFSHVYRKFGTAVVNSELAGVLSPREQQKFSVAAYGLAGRGVVENVIQWAVTERFGSVQFVFEDGDLDKGHLVHLMAQDKLPIPIFKPKIDTSTKYGMRPALAPLQAADILAYEYRLVLQRDASAQSRWGYEQFDKMPGEIRKYSLADLRSIKAAKRAGEVL